MSDVGGVGEEQVEDLVVVLLVITVRLSPKAAATSHAFKHKIREHKIREHKIREHKIRDFEKYLCAAISAPRD